MKSIIVEFGCWGGLGWGDRVGKEKESADVKLRNNFQLLEKAMSSMDRNQQYRSIVRQVLNDYYRLYSQSENPNLETMILNDEIQDQYLLLRMGWDGDRRINRTVIHLRLRHEKVWVEEDWTEQGVATDLLEMGVGRGDRAWVSAATFEGTYGVCGGLMGDRFWMWEGRSFERWEF